MNEEKKPFSRIDLRRIKLQSERMQTFSNEYAELIYKHNLKMKDVAMSFAVFMSSQINGHAKEETNTEEEYKKNVKYGTEYIRELIDMVFKHHFQGLASNMREKIDLFTEDFSERKNKLY